MQSNYATEAPVPRAAAATSTSDAAVARVLKQYWGYDSLRPLQAEAIRAGASGRDSLVVLPTGGGKSLCYQIPPMVCNRVDVVVSPLISLMKDQVDGLRENGYPAVALHSAQEGSTNREIMRQIGEGKYRLVFVAPERLLHPAFLSLCDRARVGAFAVDEAHCISQWGHDFRKDYRQLARLREVFPNASINAFTATATPRVRTDIVSQLRLRDPAILVGHFDRPNLTYRVRPKLDVEGQTLRTIRRHRDQAVIVYCLSRKETERMAAFLKENRVRAAHYHAGMEAKDRQETQERFLNEQLDVIVATVAFGMGIDRGDVRCVIHTSLPKSVEHYQQETGRAGRDGLPADCVLFYSAGDAIRNEELIRLSAENANDPETVIEGGIQLLSAMRSYCDLPACRHARLVEYFGQTLAHSNCKACDVCLGETKPADDATELARKVLSCVARVQQRFGLGHVRDVLLGKNTKVIRDLGHDKLTTHGLLKTMNADVLTQVMYQMVDQGLLRRTTGDRPIVQLSESGLRAMKGEMRVWLSVPQAATAASEAPARDAAESLSEAEAGLFEALRGLRRGIAEVRKVAPVAIFLDTVLIELSRTRPTTVEEFGAIPGVGARKREEFGRDFTSFIREYCDANGLTPQKKPLPLPAPSEDDEEEFARPRRTSRLNVQRQRAIEMLMDGASLDDVAHQTDRAVSTIAGYLSEMVSRNPEMDLTPWVPTEIQQAITEATIQVPDGRLTPIFELLKGRATFEQIRIVLARWRAIAARKEG
ncbi:MAG: RecQ family ATP-dependent DNA helicase [Phycisphaerae bacterium]|nr:RecQ family ATP-dependent DNA helicase [Phycisphaerae bacterium]